LHRDYSKQVFENLIKKDICYEWVQLSMGPNFKVARRERAR